MKERTVRLLSETLAADVEEVGGQIALARNIGTHPATVCRWIKDLTMPVGVWLLHLVARGACRAFKLAAGAGGFRLVPREERHSLLQRVQDLLSELMMSEAEAV